MHFEFQIGSEATPAEYIASLVECTREWMRVLKPEGSLFVNLGDKYSQRVATRPSSHQDGLFPNRPELRKDWKRDRAAGLARMPYENVIDGDGSYVREKSLIGLPWRYALACADQLGLILRAEIIWCLSGGARVYARTITGDRPVMLRDLARSYLPQSVKLWNGRQWTQVLGWNRSPDREALELELRTGERIGCTPGHRWPTSRGVIRADEIRVGDVIETTQLPEPDDPVMPKGLGDDDIGWLVGLYLAEGSRSGKMLQFAGHKDENERHGRLARIADAYHGSANVYPISENGVTCNVSGAVLVGIIDHYIGRGRTAHNKRLRMAVWQRSNRFLAMVATGYLSGDGHYDAKNDRYRLAFGPNDELAADLRTLAARLNAKISLRRYQHTRDGQRYPGWRGEWRWTRSAHHNVSPDGEVVAIRVSRAREFYDVGVADEPHLFALASGVLTHNSKPNGLPESVTDRVRRAHEQVFHFVLRPRYYSAVDEIREPHLIGNGGRQRAAARGEWYDRKDYHHGARLGLSDERALHPLGKLPGSVWSIPSQPLTVPAHLGVDHFAAFPMELPRRVIAGWSPPGVCTGCGQGRRPASVADAARTNGWALSQRSGRAWHGDGADPKRALGVAAADRNRTITGYACACPRPDAPTRPALILDPFAGTGTTMLAAWALGRDAVGVDRSADYCRLAAWRCSDPGERARAMEVPKPPPVADGQEPLFDLAAT